MYGRMTLSTEECHQSGPTFPNEHGDGSDMMHRRPFVALEVTNHLFLRLHLPPRVLTQATLALTAGR